jgi:fructokinase
LAGEVLIDRFPNESVIGGAPFNVACHLQGLGAQVLFISRIGNDVDSPMIRRAIAKAGLKEVGVQHDSQLPSGHVNVTLREGTHHFDIPANQAWDAIETADALQCMRSAQPSMLCFGTLAQRAPTSRVTMQALAQLAASQKLPVVLDLNLRQGPDNQTLARESLRLASHLKVNEEELRQLFAWELAAEEPQAAMAPWRSETFSKGVAALLQRYPLAQLVVTRGADGYAVFDGVGELMIDAPATVVPVMVDTVGAGDAFLSVVLLGHLRNWSLTATLRRASDFAAAICGIRGAVPNDRAFYQDWLNRWNVNVAAMTAQLSPMTEN